MNPAVFGQPLDITAAVTAGTTGTVAFTENDTTYCPAVLLNDSSQAVCSISSLGIGSHNITATYSGDNNYHGSSGMINQIIDEDTDGDGLFNNEEDINANGIVDPGETDPNDSDSDDDGLNDGVEVLILGTNPLLIDSNGNGIPDGNENNDGDAFTNVEEIVCGSNPVDPYSRCSMSLTWLILLLE
jgi:hypothetical protein